MRRIFEFYILESFAKRFGRIKMKRAEFLKFKLRVKIKQKVFPEILYGVRGSYVGISFAGITFA